MSIEDVISRIEELEECVAFLQRWNATDEDRQEVAKARALLVRSIEELGMAGVVAEREACAKACEQTRIEGSDHKPYEGYVDGFVDGCNQCEWAIRQRIDTGDNGLSVPLGKETT